VRPGQPAIGRLAKERQARNAAGQECIAVAARPACPLKRAEREPIEARVRPKEEAQPRRIASERGP